MATSKSTPTVVSPSTPATTSPATNAPASTLQPLMSPSNLARTPSVPTSFTPLAKADMDRLKKLTKAQRTAAAPLATELQGSTTYAQDFGPYATPQATVVSLLNGASAAAAEAIRAEAWAVYTRDLAAVTGDAALDAVGAKGQGLDYALQQNPALADQYPQLVAFTQVRSAAMSKTVAKKKTAKNKAIKAAKAAAATASTSTVAVQGAADATAAAK